MLHILRSWLKDKKAFTLVEVATVVAIVGTLALTIAPIAQEKIQQSRTIKAETQIKNLATAIASFFQDTGQFPTWKGNQKNFFEVLRSGSDATLDPKFSSGLSSLWGLTKVDHISNHLLIDKPGGEANAYKTAKLDWRGPYIGDVGTDPWGRNYLVISKGFFDAGTNTSPIFAWILSGGPNETVETDIKSQKLNSTLAENLSTKGDDVGFLLFTATSTLVD